MSAVAGYWAFGDSDPLPACRQMLAALSQFGPDASSATRVGQLAMGRNLFALLAEDAHDRQPLTSEDGCHALVADIRLDNRDELGSDLEIRTGELAGLADSTLLFQSLQKWGDEALDRILGDFAFAYFDARERRLLLARDPLGQRPLFWHAGRGFLAFASMPKGLHAIGVERSADSNSLANYLGLLPLDGDRSWYRDIQRVEPGHAVAVTAEVIAKRRYWRPQRHMLRLASFEDYVEAYRAELDAAVVRRLRTTETPIAAHLSGGWDSGAVSATAARLLRRKGGRLLALTSVPANSPGPPPPRRFSDEAPLASKTAAFHPNIDHLIVRAPADSPLDFLDRWSGMFERPPHNPCNQPWLGELRAAARSRGVRVILTGEIGNWTISAAPSSLLADYLRERGPLLWLREAMAMARRGPSRLRGILANSFGPWLPPLVWRQLSRLSSAPDLALQIALAPDFRRSNPTSPSRPPKDRFADSLQAFAAMDFGEYRKGVLAGWGIDERDPTADRRLIEFCLSLPLEMLMAHGVRRPLARSALADRLPADVLDESRKGYQGADWHHALSRDLPMIKAWIEAIGEDAQAKEIIDVELLRTLVTDWPKDDWEGPDIRARYRIALLQALAVGRFLLTSSPSGPFDATNSA